MVIDTKVVCPCCGLVFWDSHLFNRGGAVTCNRCKKTFMLNVNIVVEYITRKDCELNNEMHDWQESTWITSSDYVFLHCGKCDIGKAEKKT